MPFLNGKENHTDWRTLIHKMITVTTDEYLSVCDMNNRDRDKTSETLYLWFGHSKIVMATTNPETLLQMITTAAHANKSNYLGHP